MQGDAGRHFQCGMNLVAGQRRSKHQESVPNSNATAQHFIRYAAAPIHSSLKVIYQSLVVLSRTFIPAESPQGWNRHGPYPRRAIEAYDHVPRTSKNDMLTSNRAAPAINPIFTRLALLSLNVGLRSLTRTSIQRRPRKRHTKQSTIKTGRDPRRMDRSSGSISLSHRIWLLLETK